MDLDWTSHCVPENLLKISDLVNASVEKCLSECVRLTRLCEQNEEEASLLKMRIDDLKLRKSETEEKRLCADRDALKLTARMKAISSERESYQVQKENLTAALKDLVADVELLEQDKENREQTLKTKYKNLVKTLRIYKNLLDINVECCESDICMVRFSLKNDRATKLTLKSSDFNNWEVVDISSSNPNAKDELITYLANTKDVLGLMCKARKITA